MAEPNTDLTYYPIASSGKSYSFNENEKKLIDDLRKWSHEYFKGAQIFEAETKIDL